MIATKQLIAEAVGTCIITLFASGAILANSFTNGDLSVVGIALGYGIAVCIVTIVFGNISQGYCNPAVTVGLCATKKIPAIQAGLYLIAQLIGAIGAGAFLATIFPIDATLLYAGTPLLAAGITTTAGAVIEAFGAAILVLIILKTMSDTQSHTHHISAIVIGLAITGLSLVAGPLTGGAFNPARAFGTALISNYWINHWIYWIGPIVGGIIGAFAYQYIDQEKKSPPSR